MNTVTSADGTSIAYERLGDGRPVIVVGGATCDRAMTRPLAERLAQHFAVINYDRRGRGDSGDTTPYAVEREIEDLGPLIGAVGGTASVYGHSSGAGLALRAAAHGLPIARLVLHDPPYTPDGEEERRSSREYGEKLKALLSAGRHGDAVELFLTRVGMPPEVVDGMRHGSAWARLEAIAPTLAYDSEVMGDLARRVTAPTLVLTGGADYPWMIDVGRQLAGALPNGRHRVLEGQEHAVPPRYWYRCWWSSSPSDDQAMPLGLGVLANARFTPVDPRRWAGFADRLLGTPSARPGAYVEASRVR